MADRQPYVKHRARPASAAPLAALAGVALAAAVVVGLLVAFGAVGGVSLGGGEASPPPAPPPAATKPRKPVLRIVFPEGFTREEMAARIGEVNRIAKRKRKIEPKLRPQQYLRLSGSAKVPAGFEGTEVPHLEGFLFPATYEFHPDTTSRRLVRMQLEAFERAWKGIDLEYARSKNLSPYDVLIIASMVEKEVQVPRERALVAAVIYNRLRVGMPLGIDATIRYGLDIPPTQAILQSQLESDSPYNTREVAGLPPTPIGNPGLASIHAAAHPADVNYLYFVRKPDCRSHFFTASEREFLNYTRAGLQC
jgi:peptidoglycan lytic transglycosylase G